jgi:uncharacterized protein YndB with AHSA1/START domain
MASHQFFHDITIGRDTETVFDYVTDPASWHEWFSASLPAKGNLDAQRAGEQFRLETVQRPAKIIPLPFRHTVTCTVCKCDRPYLWEVSAESPLLEAVTSYTLSRSRHGTLLKRHFRYTPKHWLKYLEPVFRQRIRQEAQKSLANLKTALETRS